jgi:hypothetical protein
MINGRDSVGKRGFHFSVRHFVVKIPVGGFHFMRRLILGASPLLLFSLMSFGQAANQAATPNNPAQDVKDARTDMRKSDAEKKDAREEQQDIKQDTAQLHQDVKDGDKAAARQETKDIHQADQQMKQDVDKAKQDQREARQEMRKAQAGSGVGTGPRIGGRR